MYEKDDHFIVRAELPGVKKEDLRVSIQDGILMITGERKAVELPARSHYVRNEIPTGSFSRSLALPEDVRHDKIDAELRNGLLTIKVAKTEKALPREVPIR